MEIATMFPSWLLTSVVVLSISSIFAYILRSKNRSGSNPPPSPRGLPIIGNLHQVVGKLPRYKALWELSKTYGPVMLLHIGSKPLLVISSAPMAKEVLKTQDSVFCSRPISRATRRLTYNFTDAAFSPHSTHQREMKKILVAEFLGSKRSKSYKRVLAMEVEKMVHSLSLNSGNANGVDLSKMLFTLSKDVVCKVGFGNRYQEQPSKGLLWDDMVKEVLIMLNGSVGDSFPWIGGIFDKVTGWNSKLDKCAKHLDAYIEMILDQHKNDNLAEINEDEKDFVHRLLELSSAENGSGYQLTNMDMKALVLDILTGAIDSNVVTLVWVVTNIVKNPRIMKKLQSEIRKCTGRIQNVHELDTTQMTYLKMVVKETLRVHPPGPLLIPHESLSHTQVGGYDVAPGTMVFVNIWGIAREPSIWGENAEEFYPERFEKRNVEFTSGNFELLTFGGGRRSCPAVQSAPLSVEFIIANLFYWFDWKLTGGLRNEDLDMQDEGLLVISKKLPLSLIPTKHNFEEDKE